VKNKRVLWVRASRGRDVLPKELEAAGGSVEQLVVYQNVDVEAFTSEQLAEIDRGVDWIGLSSPSIARNLARVLEKADFRSQRPLKFAAISTVTEEAAIAAGLSVAAVATTFTWDGIFEAIARAELVSDPQQKKPNG